MIKRIFIAIKVELSEEMTRILSSLRAGLKNENIKWTVQDNIHITLAFIGNADASQIEIIQSMLMERCSKSKKIELIIRDIGLFKNFSDPRVIWAGIEPSEDLVQMQRLIFNGLRVSDIMIEDRPFKPHLTLGRIKRINDKSNLRKLTEKFQNTEIPKNSSQRDWI